MNSRRLRAMVDGTPVLGGSAGEMRCAAMPRRAARRVAP